MALLLQDNIMRYEQTYRPRCRDCNFPGPRLFNSTEYSPSPSIDQIQQFIQDIFDKRRLHVEAGIISLILLNRTGITLHSQNWMRLLLISLLLANKHCEDVYSVYNAKFVGFIPNLENLEINILELDFLKYLKYRLHIETETYEEYYANLQKFFPIEEEENSSNTEETDSIEEDEVLSSALDTSASSLDNIDHNTRFSRNSCFRETSPDDNIEEMDSIEEEDEVLSSAYSNLSTLDTSASSLDTIDQNSRFSRKTFRETSRDDKSNPTEDSANVYLKPRHSPSISELGLHQSNNRKHSTASYENLWRDFNFAKDSSLA